MAHEKAWLIAHNRDTNEKKCHYIRQFSEDQFTTFKKDIQTNYWPPPADVVFGHHSVGPTAPNIVMI